MPTIFVQNPQTHFIQPGSINFIPAWILLLITIFTISFWFPKKFYKKNSLISPLLLAFILGSLMPAFDDLLTYLFGPPFAHHSLFHSLVTGPALTFVLFLLISKKRTVAKYAVLGNLSHSLFNFYFDSVALLFPLTYQEWGLTDLIRIQSYWIKATHYPFLLTLFSLGIIKFFRKTR